MGTGEVWYEDSKPVWGSKSFRVEHPECKTRWFTINRSDDIRVWRIFPGFILYFIPTIWAGDYMPSYGVKLECNQGAKGAPAAQQQQQQQQQTVIIGVPGGNVQGAGTAPVPSGCQKDRDCKGKRVCNAGACVDPR